MKWLICFAYWSLLLSIKCATEMSAYLSFVGIHKKKSTHWIDIFLHSWMEWKLSHKRFKSNNNINNQLIIIFSITFWKQINIRIEMRVRCRKTKKNQWQWQAVQLKSFQLRNERHTHTKTYAGNERVERSMVFYVRNNRVTHFKRTAIKTFSSIFHCVMTAQTESEWKSGYKQCQSINLLLTGCHNVSYGNSSFTL